MPVPTKMSRRSSFLMKPTLYAGHAVTTKASGTATIQANTRQYQWTFERLVGVDCSGFDPRPRRDPPPDPLTSSGDAVAATVADTAAAVRTGAPRVAPSSAGAVRGGAFSVRRGGGAT